MLSSLTGLDGLYEPCLEKACDFCSCDKQLTAVFRNECKFEFRLVSRDFALHFLDNRHALHGGGRGAIVKELA